MYIYISLVYNTPGGEAMAKTRSEINNAYAKKAYDSLRIIVPKGQKATVEAAAQEAGESVNLYTQKALLNRMGLSEWPHSEKEEG